MDRLPTAEAAELAWIAVLEALEADMAALCRYTADSEGLFELPTGWEPPANVGPLPASLKLRAQSVFQQMQELSVLLKGRSNEIARQLRAVDSVPRVETTTSLYIDMVG